MASRPKVTGVGRHNRKEKQWGMMPFNRRAITQPKTDGEAYELVLSFFYVNGKRHGSKTRLGNALGCTRATVDAWEKNGLPIKYIRELKKLTGLPGKYIYPSYWALME